jgi:hypothetical protein
MYAFTSSLNISGRLAESKYAFYYYQVQTQEANRKHH